MQTRHHLVSCLLIAACGAGQAAPAEETLPNEATREVECPMGPADTAFVAEFLKQWRHTLELDLRWPVDRPLPSMVLAGRECSYYVNTGVDGSHTIHTELTWNDQPVAIRSRRNGESILLPGGDETAIGPASWSRLRNGGTPFFFLGLMDLWSEHPRASQIPGAADFVLSIAIHELMHAEQLPSLEQAVVEAGLGVEGGMTDNDSEAALADNAGYQTAIQAEIDLFWEALTLQGDERAAKVREAIAIHDARHIGVHSRDPSAPRRRREYHRF